MQLTENLKKKFCPWQIKILLKIILARVPLAYRFWHKLGVFVHGAMTDSRYAERIFDMHMQQFDLYDGFVCLELGPGDSLLTAVLAKLRGGGKTYLVDVGRFAGDDVRPYTETAMKDSGTVFRQASMQWRSVGDVLRACNAEYMTDGLKSLRNIPDASVDFIFSNAVLEHVKKEEFEQVVFEMRRILKPGGRCSHEVDLRDHLASSLNSLRFSERWWESSLFATSGFYTNRIRHSQALEIFRRVGFEPQVVDLSRWSRLPVPREKLDAQFQHLSDEELMISRFRVLLR